MMRGLFALAPLAASCVLGFMIDSAGVHNNQLFWALGAIAGSMATALVVRA